MTDASAIARLATELGYPTSDDDVVARLNSLLNRSEYFIAIAEEDGSVVGWAAAEHRMLLESGERAEVVGLVVTARARRRGIGSALVREAESWAQARGLQTIGVRSNVVRAEAHPFYEGLGYERTKTQHAYSKRLASG